MPVTDREIVMKKDDLLVTRTNLKGIITYANDAFVAISGYTREELIGASHNIVRHPDMPPEAFEDLWQCLKQGKPWTAPVKNRTKSGDYYWVEANVTPAYQNGVLHEYLSVRYTPSRDQISQADLLYKKINAKKAQMAASGLSALVKSIQELAIWKKSAFSTLTLSGLIGFQCYRLFLSGEYLLLSVVALLAISALAVNLLINRTFGQLIENCIGTMYRLADGKFRNTFDLKRQDQIGDFLRGLYSMQVKLNADLAESKENAAAQLRLNQALDNVQSGVMVADTNLNIIYMNKSVQKLFIDLEQDIRKQLPDFEAKNLIGRNIDSFHKNPAHQRGMLAKLTGMYRSELSIANLNMAVVVNPVVDGTGERIGFVAEWSDRAVEVTLEQEVSRVLQSAAMGDFTQRIKEQGIEGYVLALAKNINQLMETTAGGINDVVRVLEALARGDLTETITNDYFGTFKQLKDDVNTTVENLKALIGEIRESTDNINTAAREIAMGNNDLSHRTEEQAASLEQTAASMEQLTTTVQANTENAKQGNRVVQGATEVANQGSAVVNKVVATMESISASSHKIGEIISVIDGIAFQTNILALNAAVEAARAGDQGRGFAVVAGEVRNLAQRAAAAAGEIKALISDSEEKVSAGSKLVSQAGLTMQQIVAAINNVSSIMTEITAASVEQSSGISQVNQAIGQMDDVTQQNAALVEQAAASAESLEDQSQNLLGNVAKFKVDNRAPKIKTVQPIKTQQVGREPTASAKAIVSVDWEEF